MKVNDVLEFLSNKFPLDTAANFDNVGLLVGDKNQDIYNVLLTLDLTIKELQIAMDNKCDLIITHHPLIFSPLKSVTNNSIVFELIKNNISVISMHTNLDSGIDGVNDCLCKDIGLENIEIFVTCEGLSIRSGKVKPISPDLFAQKLKSSLNTRVKFSVAEKDIEKILVCSGSGGDFVYDAISNGFDALVTADIKHHQFLDGVQNGVSVFDCGHFETEDIIIEPLFNILKNEFNNVNFISSHINQIKYI